MTKADTQKTNVKQKIRKYELIKSKTITKRRAWTPKRRADARKRALKSRPWRHSTGPQSWNGKLCASRNAYQDGWFSADFQRDLARLNAVLKRQAQFVKYIIETQLRSKPRPVNFQP